MAIFRGTDKKPDERAPTPQPDPADGSPAPQVPLPRVEESDVGGRYPQPGRAAGEEQEQLDNYRHRASQEPADYYSPAGENSSPRFYGGQSGQRLAAKFGPKKSGGGQASSALGRKVAIGLISFLLPTLMGMIIYFLFLAAGGNLEHINRVTNAARFAGLHGEIRRRANHINKVYTLETVLNDGAGARAIARQQRTSLAKRLITGGWDADKARLTLLEHDIDIKYKRFQPGPGFFRRTIATVDYGDGPVDVRTQADVDRLHRTINRRLPSSTFPEWLHTQATARWVAKKSRQPFSRFRRTINRLRAGDLANEPGVVRRAITTSILNSRAARRLVSFESAIGGGDVNRQAEVLTEEIRDGEIVDTKQARERLRQLHNSKFKNHPIRNVLKKVGDFALITELLTWSCMFNDLGEQIEGAFRLRVSSSQESASTLLTFTNQMKAGEAHPQVVSDFAKRFGGFEKAATYKALVSDLPFEAEVDFSQAFSSTKVFGMSIAGIRSLAGTLGAPAGAVFALINSLIGGYNFLNPFSTIPTISCRDFLNPVVQIGLAVIELIATLIPGIGAAKASIGGAAKIALKTGWQRILGRVALGVGAVSLELFIFDHVVPIMMENISGVDTGLLPGPEDIKLTSSASVFNGWGGSVNALSNKDTLYLDRDVNEAAFYQGAQNFATIDYGMHYLKEQRGLISGASRRSVAEETRRTVAYMDAYKSQFAQEGLFSNLFSLNNPFSIASTLAIKSPNHFGDASRQFAGVLTSLFGGRLFGGLFDSAQAQTLSQAELQQLLYPGQKWVTGFDQAELDGENGFDFLDNSQWVEENLDELRNDFADCLVIDVGSFLYSQTYEDGSDEANKHYPPKCYRDVAELAGKYDRRDAVKRFKIYLQDCVLIESILLEGTGHSPFFSDACEHLLPDPTEENGLANPVIYEDPAL